MLIHNPKDLGLYIRNQRKSQKLSQSEIGSTVALKQATISYFENKPDGAKIETLFRILSAANLELHLIPKGQEMDNEQGKWDESW